jgi:hypothetical protein
MWFQVELPQPVMLSELEFDSPAPPAGRGGGGRGGPATPAAAPYPRGYRVEVSLDGTKWSPKPVTEGKGAGAHTVISFAPVRAKFVRITQTATAPDAPPWSVLRLRLFESPGSTPSQ